MEQTTIFQILSDQTRLRALVLMAEVGELCVCELVEALGITQPKISRHMALMRSAGVVATRRHAQWVFYFVNPALDDWQKKVLDAAVAGTKTSAIVAKDRRRLAAMKDRPEHCRIG